MMDIKRLNKPYQFVAIAGFFLFFFFVQFLAASWSSAVAAPAVAVAFFFGFLVLAALLVCALVYYDVRIDWPMLTAVIALTGLGALMGWRLASSTGGFCSIFLKRAVGICGLTVTAVYFSRREALLGLLRRYFLIAAGVMLFSILIGLFLKITDGGVFFGWRVPWDFFKVLLTIVFAGYLADYGPELSKTWHWLPRFKLCVWGPLVFLWLIPLVGILLLHDFGQVLIYGILVLALLFMATGRLFYPLYAASSVLAGTLLIFNFQSFVPAVILKRFDICLNIWNSEISDIWWNRFYQTVNSLFAVDSGGVVGSGLGWGYPRLVYSIENDCVYTGLVEEGGWLLGMAVLALYLVIILRGFAIASKARNPFLHMLAAGFTIMFAIQALLNIGGVLNIIPMTGISLPLLSSSGTSLFTNLVMMGFLFAINHVNKEEEGPDTRTDSAGDQK